MAEYVNALLTGKVALITGASRGIGKVTAERYAEEGAIVYANARQLGSIDQWAKDCSEKFSGQIIPLYFDVTCADQAKKAIMQIRSEQKRLDILVNNAGMMSNKLLEMISQEDLEQLFSTNVYAVISMMQLAVKLMARQNSGSIINISSIVGVRGNAGQLAYSATKGAVISLTKSAAKELAGRNIRVNSVAPGLTDTDGLNSASRDKLENRISNIGMGRLATPEDVANACVFLGSDLSSYISGEILGVNGCAIM